MKILATLVFVLALFYAAPAPAQVDWAPCGVEGDQCSFSGTKEVRYGASGSYVIEVHTDGVLCSNDIFGDPLPGAGKACEFRDVQGGGIPIDPSDDCHWISGACLVTGTTSTWTKDGQVWAGNPFCAGGNGEPSFITAPGSDAIDRGALLEHHCPGPGASSQYPRVLIAGWYDSPCSEWYGAGPDIGACEFVPGGAPPLGVLTTIIQS